MLRRRRHGARSPVKAAYCALLVTLLALLLPGAARATNAAAADAFAPATVRYEERQAAAAVPDSATARVTRAARPRAESGGAAPEGVATDAPLCGWPPRLPLSDSVGVRTLPLAPPLRRKPAATPSSPRDPPAPAPLEID